ncbi:MAG: dipeptide epimerase [Candidatus Hinthialibacter antarcticus]|nr:dipeptide epimerase [Candidatus Hinthialibacter antarcticus]
MHHCEIKELQLRDPFGIARGTRTSVKNLFVKFGDGWGEGAPIYYKGQDVEYMLKLAQAFLPSVENTITPENAAQLVLKQFPKESALAEAVDLAAHDAWAKVIGKPLYQIWNINPAKTPVSTFTIGLDTIEVILEKLNRVRDWPVLKIKLGSERDLEILSAIRKEYSGTLFIDANEGWGAEQAGEFMPKLDELGVRLVEQPIHRDDLDGYAKLSELNQTDIPIFVDEGVQGPEDIARWIGVVDGINIKLAKCGGLARARKMIEIARQNGMGILLGCMIESSLAISAAAQIAPLVDFVDLDGAALLSGDPFEGMRLDKGVMTLSQHNGLGAVER